MKPIICQVQPDNLFSFHFSGFTITEYQIKMMYVDVLSHGGTLRDIGGFWCLRESFCARLCCCGIMSFLNVHVHYWWK